MFTLDDLKVATALVHAEISPTPQIAWPLLAERAGCRVVVKHENHTPAGAFKIRGGLVYMERLKRERPWVNGVISATRGNHGQSLAFAGRKHGVPVTIVVPHGNSREKNAAMCAFGAELIEFGADFDEARTEAARLAGERGLEFAPSFHPDLVLGVATYSYELFGAEPELDTLYVPIGLGSGICGAILVRDLLGLKTRIVGVVSTEAQAYRLSFEAGRVIETNSARTFADGMAVRKPDAQALGIILDGADRVIAVSDDEVAGAVRAYYQDTHNLAEGAGAAPLAGLLRERGRFGGKTCGVVLCGGNIDMPVMAEVMAGRTPRV